MDDRSVSQWIVLFGLGIAYFPLYLSPLSTTLGFDLGPRNPPDIIIWNWFAVLILTIYIYYIEKKNLSSILITLPSRKDVFWAITFGIIGIIGQIVFTTILQPITQNIDTIIELSLPVIMGLILTTSITEEILYRGYVIERIELVTGRQGIAIGVSIFLFLIPHITFFGPHWLLTNGGNVILIYLLYIWRRNLIACMIMHLMGNSLLLLPILFLT